MSPRWILVCAALALCMWTACKGDKSEKDSPDKTPATDTNIVTRCEQLAKACGDDDKKVQKFIGECKQAAKEQVASGCTEKVIAAYDCLEKELCGKDPVWSMNDLRVLSERHGKCVAEREAVQTCVGN